MLGIGLAVGFFHWAAKSSSAKPTLREILPRSVQVNSKTELTVIGSFPTWPVDVWCDRPGLRFTVGKKGKLTIETTKNTLPGIYLVSLRDPTGVSLPVPLVVDSARSVTEKEPNARPGQANQIEVPANVTGTLAKSGDVDCFEVKCKKDEVLYAGMHANPLFGTTMDGVIQVCDSNGFVLDQNDDRIGIDPSIKVTIPKDGSYLVRVFAFPATPNSTVRFAGGADYRYLLTITNGPALQLAFPLTDKLDSEEYQAVGSGNFDGLKLIKSTIDDEAVIFHSPNSVGFFELGKGHANSKVAIGRDGLPAKGLSVPFDFTGMLKTPRQLDWIPFQGSKSKKIRFVIEARRYGLELDPSVEVYDAKGKKLYAKDDNSKTDPDLSFEFTPRVDGIYYLRVKDAADAGGEKYLYRCRAEFAQPAYTLSVSAPRFEFSTAKPIEIEVKVARSNGFKDPIEIKLEGLSDKARCPAVVSKVKEKTEKTVKLVVSSEEHFQSLVRIIGTVAGKKQSAQVVLNSGRHVNDIWITSLQAKTKK